jgi:hypothetical protein
MLKSLLRKEGNVTPRTVSNPRSNWDLYLSGRENIDNSREYTCTPRSYRQPKVP